MDFTHSFTQRIGLNYLVALRTSLQMKGIRIEREAYLRSVLSKYCYDHVVNSAIKTTPARAGVPGIVIDIIAETAIREEADRVAKGSFVTGLPGGVLGVAGIVGDMAQFFCISLRIIQKLVYLYGGDGFYEDNVINEEVEYRFTCFLSIMFGIDVETSDFKKYAMYSLVPHLERKIRNQVVTKALYLPIFKRLTRRIGVKVTKNSFAKSISKTIPIGGAYISSKFARGFFISKAEELQTFLQDLEEQSQLIRWDEF